MSETYESQINETINKIFEYMDWYVSYEKATTDFERRTLCLKYGNEISTLLLECKKKCEVYFEEIVDQPIYITSDYNRLRKFLVHWYAAFNCTARQEQQVSDINFIDQSLLLQSLGYTLYAEHSKMNQRTLCTQLSDLYAQKGTPLCMSKAFSLLGISNFTIFEYWLDRDPADDQLRFNPTPIDDIDYNTGLAMDARPAKPYEAVVLADPHWYTTKGDIEVAEANGELALPSMTPYIGIVSANDWVKNSRVAMAHVTRIVTDTYDKILHEPGYTIDTARKYFFYLTGKPVSLLELYLSIGYVYNEMYGRTEVAGRNNIDEYVPHFNGDEEVLTSEIQYVSEFNKVYKRTYNRDERDAFLKASRENWETLNPITTWTHAQSELVLNDVAPDFKKLCDDMLSSGQGFDFLKELLTMLDYYVNHDIGLVNYTSLFMLYDPIQENKEVLTKVMNFFKPYPTRLIEIASYIIINDIPGDCFATKETIRMEISQVLVEYYLLIKDLLKQRISEKFHDIAGRPGAEHMFDDIVKTLIVEKKVEIYHNIREKILKINISDVFVEIYTLFNDLIKVSSKEILGDRLGFNFENLLNPWPSGTVMVKNMTPVKERITEDRFLSLNQTNKSIFKSLFADYLLLYKDRVQVRDVKATDIVRDGFLMNRISSEGDVIRFEHSGRMHIRNLMKPISNFTEYYKELQSAFRDIIRSLFIDKRLIVKDRNSDAPVESPKDGYMFNSRYSRTGVNYSGLSKIRNIYSVLEDIEEEMEAKILARSSETVLKIERLKLYKDGLDVVINESGLTFSTDTWDPTGNNDYTIIYDTNNVDFKPDQLASVRNTEGQEVGIVMMYAGDTLALKNTTTFAGRVVLTKLDARIDIPASDWTLDFETGQYVYYIDPLLYGLDPMNPHIIRVLNSDTNENLGVNITNYLDGTIELIAIEPFNAHVLVAIGEISKMFNGTSDWAESTDGQYRLTINPYQVGLPDDVFEYIVTVMDEEGNVVSVDVTYDVSGRVVLTSGFKIPGIVIISD